MPFQKGQVANPEGNNGRKLLVDALHTFITRPWEGKEPDLPANPTVAHAMAHRLIKGAMCDDWKPGESLQYFQEICDRAYGKPKQALTGGDDGDKPLFPESVQVNLVRNSTG